MCWEIDYRFLEEERKAQEAHLKQEQQRAGVIKELLDDANKADKPAVEATPPQEVATAK
jgi:hypothetical protein